MKEANYSNILVFLASVILIGALGVFLTIDSSPLESPSAIKLEFKGQPTIGNEKALVHLVVFEEPKCPDCKHFTNHIFPKIKKDFIDTNEVLYTIIPVSFLPDSMPAAVAWLCVLNQKAGSANPDLFFTYVNEMYAHQFPIDVNWATVENLKKIAKEASPAINLDVLGNCIAQETYRAQIEKNTDYGMQIMNEELGTPTLYINGVEVQEMSYSNISRMIHAALLRAGEKSKED